MREIRIIKIYDRKYDSYDYQASCLSISSMLSEWDKVDEDKLFEIQKAVHNANSYNKNWIYVLNVKKKQNCVN